MQSQVGQDKWVLETLNNKKNGYFVEVGAYDGKHASNTYFMEKNMNWKGLCVEPNYTLFDNLKKNRNCLLSKDLVYSETGKKLNFQIDDTLSGILNEHSGGMIRKNKETVSLNSISLKDLFVKYDVPKYIDYLSLDVEGQEYEILKNFPFEDYIFSCVTVEHNEPHQGPDLRNKLRKLLTDNEYIFVKGNDDILNWNHGPIDDFYIHKSLNLK